MKMGSIATNECLCLILIRVESWIMMMIYNHDATLPMRLLLAYNVRVKEYIRQETNTLGVAFLRIWLASLFQALKPRAPEPPTSFTPPERQYAKSSTAIYLESLVPWYYSFSRGFFARTLSSLFR